MKSEIKVHDSFSSVIRSLNQFFTTVPGIVERRKAESGVLAEAEKPTSRPQIQISYESGIKLIASVMQTLYTELFCHVSE